MSHRFIIQYIVPFVLTLVILTYNAWDKAKYKGISYDLAIDGAAKGIGAVAIFALILYFFRLTFR
jgi:hypothetical protein